MVFARSYRTQLTTALVGITRTVLVEDIAVASLVNPAAAMRRSLTRASSGRVMKPEHALKKP
jgi:hypothetical protein